MSSAPSGDVGHDIFLDFLNRDARQFFGLYRRLPARVHQRLLAQALNICVFTARDACLMPPGFLAEDRLVRDLLDTKPAYRDERVIRLPIRETLDEFWAKKEREYRNVRDSYEGLFDQRARRFIEKNAHLLIDRPFEVGGALVARWEEAPDVSPYWHERLSSYPAPVVELFRRVPRQLAEDGLAVTWSAIAQRLTDLCTRYPGYRRLVQHIYFSIYTEALDLKVVSDLPLIHESFGLAANHHFYDFGSMRTIIAPMGIWDTLRAMSARSMVELRQTPGYFEFRRLAWELCELCLTPYSLREATALDPADRRRLVAGTSGLARLESPSLALGLDDIDLSADEVAAVGQRLEDFARLYLQRRLEIGSRPTAGRAGVVRLRPTVRRPPESDVMMADFPDDGFLAVFAALREERDVLIRDWKLSPAADSLPFWHGQLANGTPVALYAAERMGRVPAAVATARFLTTVPRPRGLLIVGIAGGFAESKVAVGDILVPSMVADLATRKVESDATADGRVRPQPYELDNRLGRFLDSGFDFAAWTLQACEDLDWPSGRRPRMHPGCPGGTLASVDEVIASDERRRALLAAWPNLLGVEMEAGGVLAAAREFVGPGLPVFQLRIVSDMADPAKSDDEWRKLGIRTLAHLVNQVSWLSLLER